ncbi:MAG: radical SAM protein [Nitrospirae bacterium]|nr:MAG: radical SAM protein [Nitrospirota bacterium]
MNNQFDSILINVPVSSPLHPQANLPLLKGYLTSHGFNSKVIDSNILFFHYYLGLTDSHKLKLGIEECFENPISILSFYSDIEKQLWKKNRENEGLDVGLRYVNLKYDRTKFDSVLAAVKDKKANPFIAFYEQFIETNIRNTGARIVGIAITFQDQIIAAFTLARLLRKHFPSMKIVMGGQMVTRCYDTMIKHSGLCSYYDYVALWEGEKTLLDIHRKVIRNENVEMINVVDINEMTYNINRQMNAPLSDEIPSPDFSDIDFNLYFFPEMLVPLQTTRGCYGKCEFCAIPFGANSYRMRRVERIIRDIENIQEYTFATYRRKATYFKFMEDTSSPSLLYSLSEEIEKRGIDAKWETFARLEKTFMKPGFMEQLFSGGCRKIHWGLESSDPSVLQQMNKKTTAQDSDMILELSAKAGILNFCFILVGFPGETDEARENMAQYIIHNLNIHTITIATFDLTRGAPMEREFVPDNPYHLEMRPAMDFQVRLPYLVNGENWKGKIIPSAHKIMLDVVRERPDIGFMTLFPDQIRSIYCEKFTNAWGQIFLERYGRESITEMLTHTEKYINDYKNKHDIDPALLPEPLRREHFRTKEDLKLIASAIMTRKDYESRRADQV